MTTKIVLALVMTAAGWGAPITGGFFYLDRNSASVSVSGGDFSATMIHNPDSPFSYAFGGFPPYTIYPSFFWAASSGTVIYNGANYNVPNPNVFNLGIPPNYGPYALITFEATPTSQPLTITGPGSYDLTWEVSASFRLYADGSPYTSFYSETANGFAAGAISVHSGWPDGIPPGRQEFLFWDGVTANITSTLSPEPGTWLAGLAVIGFLICQVKRRPHS